MTERYLGDSVYGDFDEHMITIWTDNGAGRENVIYLEPSVLNSLVELIQEFNNSDEGE